MFCESCGAAVGGPRDAAREHIENDRGLAGGANDRGLTHPRNEDALFVEVIGDGAVAVVCDGVSASAAPHIAAQVAAETTGRTLSDALRRRERDTSWERRWDARRVVADAMAEADQAVCRVPCLPSARRAAPSCTVVGARGTARWSRSAELATAAPTGSARPALND